jgi:hypothetical protein
VQYAVNTPDVVGNDSQTHSGGADDMHFGIDDDDADASAAAAAAAAADAAAGGRGRRPTPLTASLTIRYIGKPLFVPNAAGGPSLFKGYQYARALPAYLSRMVSPKRFLIGQESPLLEAEDPATAKAGGGGAGDDDVVIGPYGLPAPPPRQTQLE